MIRFKRLSAVLHASAAPLLTVTPLPAAVLAVPIVVLGACEKDDVVDDSGWGSGGFSSGSSPAMTGGRSSGGETSDGGTSGDGGSSDGGSSDGGGAGERGDGGERADGGDGGNAGSGGTSGGGGENGGDACTDVLGHTMFYETISDGLEWDSGYWSGEAHEVEFGTPDPADPVGLANRRGTGEVRVNGDGTLTMNGSQPRLYLGTVDDHPWLNTEVTVYYRRIEDDGTAWGGLVVGARSGPDGHGNDNCTATTYYARLRHDGDIDFAKELEHSTSLARNGKPIWDGEDSPRGQWIGMKYIVTNTTEGSVRLQVYRDLTNGEDGGNWELLLDELDDGGWAPTHSCSYEPDHIILEGGGVTFIRNTGLTGEGANYRDLTVREIDPKAPCE